MNTAIFSLVQKIYNYLTKPQSGYQFFTSSGVFTVPRLVYKINFIMIGGGSGGESISGGGGGGSGKVVCQIGYPVIPRQEYSISIGAGGAASTAGGTSTITTPSGNIINAYGGETGDNGVGGAGDSGGGGGAYSASWGGAGGSGKAGDSTADHAGGIGKYSAEPSTLFPILYYKYGSGGTGGYSYDSSFDVGGGGGAGLYVVSPFVVGTGTPVPVMSLYNNYSLFNPFDVGISIGPSNGGKGGDGSDYGTGTSGQPGTGYGSGGGGGGQGSSHETGGAGSSGCCLITWNTNIK